MKTKLSKLCIAILGVFLISAVSLNAQETYDDILENVKNKEMYETIDLIRLDRELSTFANLITLSGLNVSMEFAKDHTVFAPTNEAFKKLSIEKFNALTDPKNKVALMRFIKDHILPSKVMSSDFNDSHVINNKDPEEINIVVDNGMVYIGGAKIVKSDIPASNGIIHVVENVVTDTRDVLPAE